MPECGNNQAHIKKHNVSYFLYMEKKYNYETEDL